MKNHLSILLVLIKKHLSILLVLLLLLSLAGCSSGEASGNPGKEAAVSDTNDDAAAEEAASGKEFSEDTVIEVETEALSDVALMGGVPASPGNIKRSSFSTADDNLCLNFYSDTGMKNVLRINEPGIGAPFTLKDGLLVNDVFRLDHFRDSYYYLYDLWGYGHVSFDCTKEYSIEDLKNTQTLLKQSGNWYLFYNEGYDYWTIFLEIPGDDYLVKIRSGAETEEEQAALFDRLITQTEVGGIEYDEWDNVIRTTVSAQDTASKDLSDWRFIRDMVWDYYGSLGIHPQSATAICAFNYNNRGDVSSYQKYFYDGNACYCGFTIYPITSDEYAAASAENEVCPIDIAAFDESCFQYGYQNATVFAKIGSNYFKITSGVPCYSAEDIWKVAAVFDQVFFY